MTGSYKTGGLVKDKYRIEKKRTRGQEDLGMGLYVPIDKEAQYFVLRVDADPHARAALEAYAISIQLDNKQLSEDIFVWLEEIEEQRQN